MIENYGLSDIFFQIVRICLLGSLCWLPAFLIKLEDNKFLWLLILASICVGSILYFILLTIFDQIMWLTANCESLGAFDAIFLLDDKKNYSNNLGVLQFEKFEFEQMK